MLPKGQLRRQAWLQVLLLITYVSLSAQLLKEGAVKDLDTTKDGTSPARPSAREQSQRGGSSQAALMQKSLPMFDPMEKLYLTGEIGSFISEDATFLVEGLGKQDVLHRLQIRERIDTQKLFKLSELVRCRTCCSGGLQLFPALANLPRKDAIPTPPAYLNILCGWDGLDLGAT